MPRYANSAIAAVLAILLTAASVHQLITVPAPAGLVTAELA